MKKGEQMNKKNLLTIVIGGDMEKDEMEFFENPDKAILQPQKMVYVDSYEQLHQMLSPARLDLLRYLIQLKHQKQTKGVGEIAKVLDRKTEAISRDLHYLSGRRLIELKKKKQTVLPQTDLDGIEIQLVEAQ
jgi:predicted transcriptional regulator